MGRSDMRQYRGKRKDNGEWVKGWYVYRGCVPNDTHYVYSSGFHYEVDPATVGQSTGLKDKHGKEIYEGDIVKHPTTELYAEEYYIVKYRGGCFVQQRKSSDSEPDNAYEQIDWEWDKLEIIGNVHEKE